MNFSEQTISLLNLLITVLIAISSSILTTIYNGKAERQHTSRIIFDRCYSKIYTLIKYNLYSKSISLEQVQNYGEEILVICTQADNYYYPSLKQYADWLANSGENSYQENWQTFCRTFSIQYDKTCKDIGVPLRSPAYRLNKRHYSSKTELFVLFFRLTWPGLIFLSLGLLIYTFMRINS